MKTKWLTRLFSPGFCSLVILFAGIVTWIRRGEPFWVLPDRQAQHLLDSGAAKEASERFIDPVRRGVAQYRSGDFESALQTFAALAGPDQRFNQGNALVMLGRYDDAVEVYQQVLAMVPDRQDAQINLRVARGRAERVRDKGGQMTDGKLGADDVVFQPMKNEGPQGENEATESTPMTDEEMRGLWLRQVQTTPSDFLRTKFAYQFAMQSDANEEAADASVQSN
ncbi:MAG: tetratricopeptide repeat protein [Planctomycetota bacterium]